VEWYARLDSNQRPFAPEVKQINHLQTMVYENTRLSEVPVGPRMDLVRRFSGFWTLPGPRSGDHGPFPTGTNAQSRDRRLHRDGFPAFGTLSGPRSHGAIICHVDQASKSSVRSGTNAFTWGLLPLARALPRFSRSSVEQTTRGLLYVKGFFDPRHRPGVRNTPPGCPPGRG